ncbi:MAG TPA: hypothetical protein VMB79_18905 [Jatrophihabitans sp.]|nr:hypothetical protein [Jatrophihabitans sp.]
MRRLTRLLATGLLTGGLGLVTAPSASATALPMSQCTTTSGVVVAVDFGAWGGPVVRGCGATPTTGYQLISQGGFSVTPVGRFPGFVCRIAYSGFAGGTPEPATGSCANTPPASQSWSFWTADPGQSGWTLSPKGAGDSNPGPGAVQAWTFSGGAQPSFTPDAVRSHTVAPTRAPAPPPASAPAAGTGRQSSAGTPHASSGSVDRAAVGSGSALPSSRSAAPTTAAHRPASSPARTATGSATPAGSSAASGPAIVDAQPQASSHRSGGGTYLPGVVGGLLVLALLGAAALRARQRRRAG